MYTASSYDDYYELNGVLRPRAVDRQRGAAAGVACAAAQQRYVDYIRPCRYDLSQTVKITRKKQAKSIVFHCFIFVVVVFSIGIALGTAAIYLISVFKHIYQHRQSPWTPRKHTSINKR